jgi:hypothetical protein
LISSRLTAGSAVTSPLCRRLTSDKCSNVYNRSDACPAERTKRSRLGHRGSLGS